MSGIISTQDNFPTKLEEKWSGYLHTLFHIEVQREERKKGFPFQNRLQQIQSQ